MPPPAPQVSPVDFLLFAPLEEEREALLAKLPGHRRLDADGTDVHVYFEAELATRRQDKAVYRVVVTSPAGMGPLHAAVTASAIAARFSPEHVLVVGIAGGLRDEVALGDVMVARSVADYTVGKVHEDGSREERWESYPADVGLLNFANAFRTGWEDLVIVPRPKGTESPVRHAGVIASGGDVIASKDLVAAYRKDMPKLIGIEMEGGGVATALHSHKLRPRFLMVRGVSDLADGKGNAAMKKRWRAYARDVAAAYVVGLLRDGPVPAAPRSTAHKTSPAPSVSIGRLPVTSPELFGRKDELAWLDKCWEEGVHVATIVAWGGVGKSALVNAWLAKIRDAGWARAERVFGWSFYSQGTDRLSSSDEFIDVALRWFGDKDPRAGSPWDKGERLASLVRKQRTLLVLDGVEPLQWGPGVEQGKLKDPALQALVKELGAQNMGLCLITSRINMTDLDALAGSKVQEHGLDHLSAEAGAELLVARGAKGSKEDLQAAAKEYDGHSFALTLLGTYIRNAHRGDVRKRDIIPPLEGKPAHRMMARYEHWFENTPELAILRMLGLFDRPAPEDEIAALRAAPVIAGLTDALAGVSKSVWNEAVTALRDVGLLAAGSETEEAEKLDAHPLVREYFGEQLRRERPDAWREGHRRLYVHLKRKAKPLPDTIEEMAPLYAAVVHGCMAGKNQEARREVLMKRIQRVDEYFSFMKLGAFGSEVAVLSAFFDPPWERLAPGLSEPDQALVLSQAGFALRALGRLPEAAGLMRMGLDRRTAQESWKDAAAIASNLSELLQARGELREALERAGTSVELADKSGDAFQRMGKRTTLAAAQHAMGLRKEAAAQFEEAERIQKETQPAYPLLYSLQGFRYCDLLLDQGRDADVRERAAKFFEWRVPGDPLLDIALDHLSLGRAHLLSVERGTGGNLAQAASHLAASVDGLRRSGQQDYLPLGLLARAALHTHTRAFALARKDLDEALTLATRCGFRLFEADAHLAYARLHLAEGAPAEARPHVTSARKLIEATGYHRRDVELDELSRASGEAGG